MIRGVVELSDRTVKEVMVPRIDVVFLSAEGNPEQLIRRIRESGHSRFPIYRETFDNVIGMLYAKDLLRQLEFPGEEFRLDAVIRKPYFVPESKKLDSLLREMKRKHIHIAVAVDEYGGVSGIVCMEDIIEEIIGDIQDEFDNEKEEIVPLGENTYLCDARILIEEINEQIGLSLPNEDFDTLGGFVFDLFGKIPVKYEKVTGNGADFIVQEMDGHKIRSVKVVYHPESDEEADEA